MKRVLLSVLVAVFVLGACGDDGDSGGSGGADLDAEEQALADEISASLQEGEADDLPLEAGDADCIGTGMVAELGTEKLGGIDFSADDVDFALSEEDAEKAATVMVGCVDLGDAMAAGIAESGDISEESASCIADAFDDDTMITLFTASFQGEEIDQDAEFNRVIIEAMGECLSDEELEQLG